MDVNLPIAFGAGLISFFAPCIIPLLPAYVGYVTGVSVKDLEKKGYAAFRRKMVLTSLMYILGFSLVFVLLGSAAASIGVVFRRWGLFIQRVGGLVVLILGLEFAGILHIPFLGKQKKFQLPVWTERFGYARAFFIGLVFATSWTPCVGAVLGAILALAATSATVSTGALLLFVYSLGISLPFLLVSLTLSSAPKYLKWMNRYIGAVSKVAGWLLVVLGVLLFTNTYKYLNSFLFDVAFRLGYEIK